jgi:CRP-like cAMP-binding protein
VRERLPARDQAKFVALRATRELASCSDRDIRGLLRYADEVEVPAGLQIAGEGRLCSEFVVVIDGSLRFQSQAGRRLLGPGDAYGWSAMWERSKNRATVTAESDARLLVMSHAQFRAVKALVEPEPAWACATETAEVQIVA